MVTDSWKLRETPKSIVFTLMAADMVDASTPGLLRLAGPKRDVLVDFDSDQVIVTMERIDIDDQRMTPVWGEFITRVLLTLRDSQAVGSWTMRAHA